MNINSTSNHTTPTLDENSLKKRYEKINYPHDGVAQIVTHGINCVIIFIVALLLFSVIFTDMKALHKPSYKKATILCLTISVLRLLISETVIYFNFLNPYLASLGVEQEICCKVLVSSSVFLLDVAVMVVFFMYWMRQKELYRCKVLKKLNSCAIKTLSFVCLFTGIFTPFVLLFWFITVKKFRVDSKGFCYVLNTPYLNIYVVTFSLKLFILICLVLLFTFPLRELMKKTKLNKLASSTSVNNYVFRNRLKNTIRFDIFGLCISLLCIMVVTLCNGMLLKLNYPVHYRIVVGNISLSLLIFIFSVFVNKLFCSF